VTSVGKKSCQRGTMKMTAVSVLVNSAQISLPVWRYQPFVSQLKTSWAIFLFEFADLTTEKVSIFSYHRPIYDSPCATSKYCIVKTKKEKKKKEKKKTDRTSCESLKKIFYREWTIHSPEYSLCLPINTPCFIRLREVI